MAVRRQGRSLFSYGSKYGMLIVTKEFGKDIADRA